MKGLLTGVWMAVMESSEGRCWLATVSSSYYLEA